MRIAVVSTGEELTLGLVDNTSFGAIARRVRRAGHEVVSGAVVGDGLEVIRDAILAAARRADAVIVTGGLGPTRDDRTRAAAAAAAGVALEFREEQREVIEVLFRDRGRPVPPGNEVQAYFPVGSEVIPNPLGTAPGFVVPVESALVFALSGVPRETRTMLEDGVLSRIGDLTAGATGVRRLKVFGLPEASLDQSLGRLMAEDAEPRLGLTAKGAIHTVTIASTRPPDEAEAALRETETRIRGLLGDLVFGREDDTLAIAVVRQLARTGLSLALAESCTGGLVTSSLVDVPGVSDHLIEGVVTYADDAKVRRLGVDPETLAAHGAVSSETAAEMAEGVRLAAGADIGLSTTGIAGPGGGSAEKPVGLVYTGVSLNGRIRIARQVHFGDRRMVRDRAAKAALDVLRRELAGV